MTRVEPAAAALKGRRILIVEDEMLIAFDLQTMLADHGGVVVEPVWTVAKAVAAVEREPLDAALIDLNLKGEPATPVAAALRARSVPFVVLTGYSEREFSAPELELAPRLNKPVVSSELLQVVMDLLK